MPARPDLVAVGHVTRDLLPDGTYTIGGTATYASLAALRLGASVAVLTSAPDDLDLSAALPGVAVHYLLGRGFGPQTPRMRALAAGALCGVVGIGGAALLASAVLALSGGRMFDELIVLFVAAHLPVLVVDAAIGALTVAALVRLMPQALART